MMLDENSTFAFSGTEQAEQNASRSPVMAVRFCKRLKAAKSIAESGCRFSTITGTPARCTRGQDRAGKGTSGDV
jgi:hypothetical protein